MIRVQEVKVYQTRPPLMCANCAQPLKQLSGVNRIFVDSSENPPTTKANCQRPVKVEECLFEIYKLDYLKQITGYDDDDDDTLVLCIECSSLLRVMYQSFDSFGQRRSSQSYLDRNIKKLDTIFNIIQSATTGSSQMDTFPPDEGRTDTTTTTTTVDEAEIITIDDKKINSEETTTVEKQTGTPSKEKRIIIKQTTGTVEEGIPDDINFDNVSNHHDPASPSPETVEIGDSDDDDGAPIFQSGVEFEVVVGVEVCDDEEGDDDDDDIQYESTIVDDNEPILMDEASINMDEPPEKSQSSQIPPVPTTKKVIVIPPNQPSSSSTNNLSKTISDVQRLGPLPEPAALKKCPRCQHFFTESADLVQHLYHDHARGLVTCPIPSCQKVAGPYDKMKTHLCRHFKIPYCFRKIQSTFAKSSAYLHKEIGLSASDFDGVPGAYLYKERGFRCCLCRRRFKMKYEIVNHVFSYHGARDSSFCLICKKEFEDTSRRGMKRHLIQHVDDVTASIKGLVKGSPEKNCKEPMSIEYRPSD